MSEFSLFHVTGAGGDGASAYTQTQLLAWLRRTFLTTPASEGVLKNYANGLAVSGTATPLTVATGAAVVDGFPYENDTAVSLAVPTPAVGTTGKRVVLRADYTAHTVRIALITSSDGVSAFPALTQVANTTWEISLATLSVTTAGVITVTDARSFAHFNTQVATANIDDLAVTTAKVADVNITTAKIADLNVTTGKLAADSVDDTKAGDRVPQFYRRQGGDAAIWSTTGTTDYVPGAVRIQAGRFDVSIPIGAQAAAQLLSYPVPFSQSPLVFASVSDSGAGAKLPTCTAKPESVSQITLYAMRPEGEATTAVRIVPLAWLAIGPE